MSFLSVAGFIHLLSLAKSFEGTSYRCSEGFCDFVGCEDVANCTKGRVEAKSSYCKCCDTCIESLAEGERCEDHLFNFTTGYCKDGLKCIYGKCEIEGSIPECFRSRTLRFAMRKKPLYSPNLWLPECDENGNFKPVQKKKRKTICVDVLGNALYGQEAGIIERCSSYIYQLELRNAATFLTKPEEHCTSSGHFAHLQCVGNFCYCANSLTGKVEGRAVLMRFRNKLPCSLEDDAEHAGNKKNEMNAFALKSYLKACEKEATRARFPRLHFVLKGNHVFGLEKLKCDPDGTFSPKQCDSQNCVCTNKEGSGGVYFIDLENYQNLASQMTCSCARDVDDAVSNTQISEMKCKGWGNYHLFQCFLGDRCFCVDEDGDVISIELRKSAANETICSSLLNDLSMVKIELSSTATLNTPVITSLKTTSEADYE